MGKKGGNVRVKQMGPKMAAPPSFDDFMIPPNEVISLPPKMDSNITNCWPMSQSFTMNYKSNEFPCIWPNYIDLDKTMKQGRRIGKELALPRPSVADISEVLQSYGVRHAIQPYKGYPRDVESRWYNAGRVLYDLNMMQSVLRGNENVPQIVELNDEDEDMPDLNDENISQKHIWKAIAKKMKDMPGRKVRIEEARKKEEAEKRKAIEEAKLRAIVSKKTTVSTGGNKKKGKKKR
jgi:signal recognition particle subunit SRP19